MIATSVHVVHLLLCAWIVCACVQCMWVGGWVLGVQSGASTHFLVGGGDRISFLSYPLFNYGAV